MSGFYDSCVQLRTNIQSSQMRPPYHWYSGPCRVGIRIQHTANLVAYRNEEGWERRVRSLMKFS
jgi:hypothetical protein